METLKKWFRDKDPFVFLLAAMVVRLLAVLFSKGFGMLDDHFLVIEAAQSWVDGTDYNNWLPKAGQDVPTPSGHSFFYPGIHYLLLKGMQSMGILDPQVKMVFIRLLHALYSMITVYYGYKIAEKLTNKQVAWQVGWLLGLLWFWPFLCVRNLVEVACIPMLVLATWIAVKDDRSTFKKYLLIGILLGVAFNIRFQSVLFAGGFGLALLFGRKWIGAIGCMAGWLLCAVTVQGSIDMFIWNHPFVEFIEYVRYNLENAETYGKQPWYNYLLLLSGILIPPISLFLLFGFFTGFRRYLILFLPSLVFLAFHSYFPNKQERFILPIIPFVIILGSISWHQFTGKSDFWINRERLMRGCWIFFWVLNSIPLLVVSVSYSKKNRVEAMSYLRLQGDVTNLLIEDSNSDSFIMSPKFYLGKWIRDFGITKTISADSIYQEYKNNPAGLQPNYVLFFQEKNIVERLIRVKKNHDLQYMTTVSPSFIDQLMHRLNPRNVNQTTYIFKITKIK